MSTKTRVLGSDGKKLFVGFFSDLTAILPRAIDVCSSEVEHTPNTFLAASPRALHFAQQ